MKMIQKYGKFQTLKPLFSFSLRHVNGFSEKRVASKVDVLKERKIYCLLACPCIFQPGNVTGWGSEGVNSQMLQAGAVKGLIVNQDSRKN